MSITTHLQEFDGKQVVDFQDNVDFDHETNIYRIRTAWNDAENWLDKFARFLTLPGIEKTSGLVIGQWESDAAGTTPRQIVQALVASREKLPELKALFFGDIIEDENEIAWIESAAMAPLLTAYPQLRILRLRGIIDLDLSGLNHAHLRHLAVESNGLPRQTLDQILQSALPNLEHLELWLGEAEYGLDFDVEALLPLFKANLFPKLTSLALCNTELSNEIAQAIVDTPILDQLAVLDLSNGTFGDEGAQALWQSESAKQMEKLNLSFHYCSSEWLKKLARLPLEVDLSNWQMDLPEIIRYSISME